MSRIQNYVLTSKSVVVVTDTGLIPVDAANPMYGTVKGLLDAGKFGEVVDALDVAQKIKRHSKGAFYVLDGVVFAEGGPMPAALSTRVIGFADADLDVAPLLAFWENLKLNPREDSRQDLYAFLEVNHVPITADGCFIGYKKVRSDFKDIYTGTMDNSVGQVVKIDRTKVDPNRNNTCSSGLHVAAFDYAANQYGSGGGSDVLLLVKVNPKDVVTVPPDYHQQKMRVCEYTVLEVYKNNAPLTSELWKGGVTPNVTADDVDGDRDDSVDESYEDDVDATSGDETAADVNAADLTATVSADKQGRVCVPNGHTKHMGLEAGDEVFVTAGEGYVIVSPERSGSDDERVYTVDRDGNVRLSAGVLRDAGLNEQDEFTVDAWEDEVEVR